MIIFLFAVLLYFVGRALEDAFGHLERGLAHLKFTEYDPDCESGEEDEV